MRRMYQEQESVFYYITCMNENYAHPAMPAGVAQGILNGMYLLQIGGRGKVRVTLFGSGTILREVLAAAQLLERDFGVPADVFSVTSFSELRKQALEIERWNLLHPGEPAKQTYIAAGARGPRGPVHRRHGLHKNRAGSDTAMDPGALCGARDGRLRAQRFARGTAPFLRGGSSLRGDRRAQSAGRCRARSTCKL